ncbi:MAG: hypothetical protein DWQ40_12490 [Actinobacteria bacterium]|nr:MAG: hypothetical protein DWQ40_12490 [Actinomycetota bacterium]
MRVKYLVMTLALIVAACGGDAEVGAGTEPASGGSESDAPSDTAPPTVGGGDFCEATLEAIAVFASGAGDEDLIEELDDLASGAPDEIKQDLVTISEAWRTILEATEAGDFAELDEDEVEDAGDRIDAYLERECGFESDDDGMIEEDPIDEDDPFAEQTVSLTLAGAYEAEETFTGLDIDCTRYGDGELWVQTIGLDEQWSIELNTTGASELVPGDYMAYNVVAVPPYESDLGQNGDVLLAEAGTLTVTDVGEVEDLGQGILLVPIAGSFDAMVSSTADGAEAQVTGSFSCSAYLIEE